MNPSAVPQIWPMLNHFIFTNAPASTGTTVMCGVMPATGTFTDVYTTCGGAITAGTLNLIIKVGSATLVNHGTATAWTADTFTDETLTTATFTKGDTVSAILIGDGTVDATINATGLIVWGQPGALA